VILADPDDDIVLAMAAGHAGTLDPLAEGVVVVCVGPATKLVDSLNELPKHYRARFLLGRSSPSDDLETPVEVDLGSGSADAVAACDEAGELVGILKRHPSGRHRLRPNFRGAG
jgi:tRNA U55 pseudouridine synthase TruB